MKNKEVSLQEKIVDLQFKVAFKPLLDGIAETQRKRKMNIDEMELEASQRYIDGPGGDLHPIDHLFEGVDTETILNEAQRIVDGPRQQEYGDKVKCFSRIAAMWGGYLGRQLTVFDVAHMMILLKIARNGNQYKRDSMVDVAGYAYCADLMHDQFLANSANPFNGEY